MNECTLFGTTGEERERERITETKDSALLLSLDVQCHMSQGDLVGGETDYKRALDLRRSASK